MSKAAGSFFQEFRSLKAGEPGRAHSATVYPLFSNSRLFAHSNHPLTRSMQLKCFGGLLRTNSHHEPPETLILTGHIFILFQQ
jgi:hypothetical protein